jgi:hypothetical protein
LPQGKKEIAMAVNAINPVHPAPTENAQPLSLPKGQSGTPKANTVNVAAGRAETGEGQANQAAGAAENNAGREQGNTRQGDTEGRGAHVNVYA